jgi:hypothetical protein
VVEVVRSTDERQARERLREVVEVLATAAELLAVELDVAKQLLEDEARLNAPERAHVEGALVAWSQSEK